MKKIILLVLTVFLSACGGDNEKKKGFEYNRTKKQNPVSLSNKKKQPLLIYPTKELDQ